ncbi:MAG: Heparinase II/III-like protein [Herminiimonas sp.]|nr:Heparinase II/III-like protein [Herminiimonas sp.]MDB5852731.1 Heparinase II/III-like protein [Herminiimonas sp.]
MNMSSCSFSTIPIIAALGIALCLAGLSPLACADWAESADPMTVRLSPAANATMQQNPPGFTWSRYGKQMSHYELRVRSTTGSIFHWTTAKTWYLPTALMPPGAYTWQVRALEDGAPWSEKRPFTISPNSASFVVPDDDQLVNRLKRKSRPRSFAFNGADEQTWRTAIMADRAATVQQLNDQVRVMASESPATDLSMVLVPKSRDPAAWAKSIATIERQTELECLQLRRSALLWRVTGDPTMLEEARRRGNVIATYDPSGGTGPHNQDQASRNIAWSLALAVDLLGNDLPALERRVWLSSITVRTQAMHDDLVGNNGRLEQRPFDSHGSVTFGYLAAISTLLVGDLPEADIWFRDSFRAYAQYVNPWGGEDGGYGNGTAYAEYAVDSTIQLWDRIWAATGVNLYTKPWSKGMLRFFVDFVPPGSATHAFGDAAETRPALHELKAFASRFADPLATWYMQSLRAPENPYTLLGAPLPLPAEQVPAKPPEHHAALYPTVGWAAMHSTIAGPHRISVYFKSSQYGAFNHSHGDQNSFVLAVDGTPVLMDTGHYDWYGSPHWQNWYRRTAAHNAVTFDGGAGQVVDGYEEPMRAGGRILAFHSDALIDSVSGDATRAYGGVLSEALRRVWYLRDLDVVVVWDKLRAPRPHVFEWNIHSAAKMTQAGLDRFIVRHENAEICMRSLLPARTRFEQSSGYSVPPQVNDPATVWHGRIKTMAPQKEAEFLQVLSVGCKLDREPLKLEMKRRELRIGVHVFRLD